MHVTRTSSPPNKKLSLLGHLFSMQQTSFAPKSVWGMRMYMPKDGHWLASFDPLQNKVGFSAAKNGKFPIIETVVSDYQNPNKCAAIHALPGNGHLRPLPGAAPPEAPKICGTGAYDTKIGCTS